MHKLKSIDLFAGIGGIVTSFFSSFFRIFVFIFRRLDSGKGLYTGAFQSPLF